MKFSLIALAAVVASADAITRPSLSVSFFVYCSALFLSLPSIIYLLYVDDDDDDDRPRLVQPFFIYII